MPPYHYNKWGWYKCSVCAKAGCNDNIKKRGIVGLEKLEIMITFAFVQDLFTNMSATKGSGFFFMLTIVDKGGKGRVR